MTVLDEITVTELHSVEPTKSHILNRGNGRRFLALKAEKRNKIPETTDIADHAPLEIVCTWHGQTIFSESHLERQKKYDDWIEAKIARQHKNETQIVDPESDYAGLDGDDIFEDYTFPDPGPMLMDITQNDCMAQLRKADGIKRPNRTKVLITARAQTAYMIMTWTDVFGASIKESQLGRKQTRIGNNVWLIYGREATTFELGHIQDALTARNIKWK